MGLIDNVRLPVAIIEKTSRNPELCFSIVDSRRIVAISLRKSYSTIQPRASRSRDHIEHMEIFKDHSRHSQLQEKHTLAVANNRN